MTAAPTDPEPTQSNLSEFPNYYERGVAARSNWFCLACGKKLKEQCPLTAEDGGFLIPTCNEQCANQFMEKVKTL